MLFTFNFHAVIKNKNRNGWKSKFFFILENAAILVGVFTKFVLVTILVILIIKVYL